MKHLRLFNESNLDKDYQSITREEWHDCYNSDERIEFTIKEVSAIENFINQNDDLNGEVRCEWNKDFTQLSLNPVLLRKSRLPWSMSYTSWSCVEKYDDEWYTVWVSGEPDHYYKCDQLRGLLECINTEIY